MIAEGYRERASTALGAAGRQPAPAQQLVVVMGRDQAFARVLADALTTAGLCSRTVSYLASVPALVRMRLHAMVLDLETLGPSGWDYLGSICSSLPALPVIVCARPTSMAQRVRGLRVGADAWVTKPCDPEELACVVEASLRRHRRDQLPGIATVTTVGGLTLRPDLYQAYANGESARLTRREYEVLHLFCQALRVLRREDLYERVWGYAMAPGDRSVDVYVRKLRQKLQTVSPEWRYIHTHFGVGYRFVPERLLEAGAGPAEPETVELALSGAPTATAIAA